MKKGSSNIEFVATMILLILFSWTAFSLVAGASQAYDKELIKNDSIVESRIALSFIDNRAKQANKSEIYIEKIDGLEVIVVEDEFGFKNNLYFTEGSLYEAMTGKEEKLDPSLGMKIADIKAFDIEDMGNLMRVQVIGENGETQSLIINKE